VIGSPAISELNVPDTEFTQHTTIQSTQFASESSEFEYFQNVHLPKIRERSLQEQERITQLEIDKEQARQQQLAQIEQERLRLEQKVREQQQREAQAEAQRQEELARQREAEQQKRQAEAAAVAIPANGDYVTLIRQRCAELGCNSQFVIDIMYCESGGRANAYNSRSGASGLFQQMPQYWASRATQYGVSGASIWDGNAQVVVATGMIAGGMSYHWTNHGCPR